MAKATLTALALILSGCHIVWDYPAVPRTDPCTGKTSTAYAYVATCEPPRPPVKIDGEPLRHR